MRIKFFLLTLTMLALVCWLAVSCSGNDAASSQTPAAPAAAPPPPPPASPKGIGEVKNVTLTDPFEESMLASGKAIYDMKCSACHKLTDQRVVGPGWAGVTNRRRPEWVMNMVTNVDVMLDEDPQARKLLEECLTRMPNQRVSIGDARALLEFMRKNDMEQVGSKDEAAI
ncbi:c-type cytochrome [Neolewinella antarctica]|uniref:Mono/diheme cytochrome c family protein n=1 Tax=Neolewinella antarctica TaxID=442734 RepID=A0ABX0XDI9_9BACT|nr:cytochrome c [Neolewinella antarctica]NJC26974.1 mono/diheme cytochrome c family protein [Neolewinella antarctica]